MRSAFWVAVSVVFALVVLAQSPTKTARPPLPTQAVAKPAMQKINVSGMWQFVMTAQDGRTQNAYDKLDQHEDMLEMCPLVGVDQCYPGVKYVGRYDGNPTIDLMINVKIPGHPNLDHEKLYVDDPDHIHSLLAGTKWSRTVAKADDVPCDDANSFHVTGPYAALRGRDAITTQQDWTKAACWFHAGAVQGEPKSQGIFAYLVYEGKGVKASEKEAFSWAQKSAEQGDMFGEFLLGDMYAHGLGTVANAKLGGYWLAKGEAQLPQTATDKSEQEMRLRSAAAAFSIMGFVLSLASDAENDPDMQDARAEERQFNANHEESIRMMNRAEQVARNPQ